MNSPACSIASIRTADPNAGLKSRVEDLERRLRLSAADNSSLKAELAAFSERQAATAEILNAIAGGPADVQRVFDVICESARSLLGGQSALVTRVASDRLHLAACTAGSVAGDEEIRKSFPVALSSSGIHSRVARTSTVAFRADIDAEPGVPQAIKTMARARGYRSILVVPMLRNGVALGTIGVSRAEPGRFPDSEVALLKTFAAEAVIAIENARLFEEVQAHAKTLTQSLNDLRAAQERAQASLSRYFSPELARRLASDGRGDDMQVRWRDIALIFTDLTRFTSLVETTAVEALPELLKDYVGGLTDVILAHGGTVAKVMGDGVQALFNAPDDQADYATRAIACAQALDKWAEAFRECRRRKGVALGVTRIGVHAGPALVGDFGGGRFIDYTAYGDTINTASRLEAANKALGTRVCVSDAVARGAENFLGRPIGELVLRGRSEPLRAFEPLFADEYDALTTTRYMAAYAKLDSHPAAAIPAFASLVSAHANDPLSSYHLRRLLNGDGGVQIEVG